ncbi:hypothetical protein [Leisingera daeponensis]|uniref:hypothetical protein n=1 Tax=Leisingera daeponensis TaxID=405746 RepID=UPI001C966DCE|nr:hypothetical protein [Leisingera daeponensis]MBY6059584.1 hypothetical protein [Leisingera daeponensis]
MKTITTRTEIKGETDAAANRSSASAVAIEDSKIVQMGINLNGAKALFRSKKTTAPRQVVRSAKKLPTYV